MILKITKIMSEKKLKISNCLDCPYKTNHPHPMPNNLVKCNHPNLDNPRKISTWQDVSSVEIPNWCPLEDYFI